MAEKQTNVAPIRLELLITVIPRKKADFYADLLQTFDVNMQMIVRGQGTAGERLLEYLGLSDSDKSVLFGVVREEKLDEIQDALEERFRTIRDGKGIAVSIPLSSVMGAAAFGFLSNTEH